MQMSTLQSQSKHYQNSGGKDCLHIQIKTHCLLINLEPDTEGGTSY